MDIRYETQEIRPPLYKLFNIQPPTSELITLYLNIQIGKTTWSTKRSVPSGHNRHLRQAITTQKMFRKFWRYLGAM